MSIRLYPHDSQRFDGINGIVAVANFASFDTDAVFAEIGSDDACEMSGAVARNSIDVADNAKNYYRDYYCD